MFLNRKRGEAQYAFATNKHGVMRQFAPFITMHTKEDQKIIVIIMKIKKKTVHATNKTKLCMPMRIAPRFVVFCGGLPVAVGLAVSIVKIVSYT